jgi:hypothetical protein
MLEQTVINKPQEAIMESSFGQKINIYLNNEKIKGVIGFQWEENYKGGWLSFSPISHFKLESNQKNHIKIIEVLSDGEGEVLYENEELLDFSVRTNKELQPQVNICFGKQQTFFDTEIDTITGTTNLEKSTTGEVKFTVDDNSGYKPICGFEFPETLYQFNSSKKAIMILKLEKCLTGKEMKIRGRYKTRIDYESNLTDYIFIEQNVITDNPSDDNTILWPVRTKLSAAISDFEQHRFVQIKKLKDELQFLELNSIPHVLR